MKADLRKILLGLLIALFLFFSYQLLLLSLPYLSFNNQINFLASKQDVIHLIHWRIAFYVHVFTSIFILLAGFTQFFKFSFRANLRLHRILGKVYIFLILFLSGPAGLLMAFYANGGWLTKLGFICLGIGWLLFTFFAYYHIRNRNLAAHRNFMIRSYAFTLSAITLRVWMFFFSWFYVDYAQSYLIVAWLSWSLNWLIAEVIIQQFEKGTPSAE